jgi:hypothetical protein
MTPPETAELERLRDEARQSLPLAQGLPPDDHDKLDEQGRSSPGYDSQ